MPSYRNMNISPQRMRTQNMAPTYPTVEAPAPGRMGHQLAYPDVYYKLNPHIQKAINQVGLNGKMPTQEAFTQMTNTVYEEVMRMHPELAGYAQVYDAGNQANTYAPMQYGRGYRRGYGPGYGRGYGRGYYGRGGLFQDLIGILLLEGIFGRRGGCCW